MKLNINEINTINLGLAELMETKIKGALKFKVLKNKLKAEELLKIAIESLEDVESEEDKKEVLELEQEVDFITLTNMELEELEITPKTLLMLDKLMEDRIND